jgi:hypothetical protein
MPLQVTLRDHKAPLKQYEISELFKKNGAIDVAIQNQYVLQVHNHI